MTRTLSSAFLALSLGFGGAAFAQDSQLAIEAQNTLDRYGYVGVDASTLTEAQLAEFQAYFGGSDDFTDDAAARQRIDLILASDAEADGVLSQQLLIQAQQTLDSYGYSAIDAEMLSASQIAEIQTSFAGEEFATEDEARNRLEQILAAEADTAIFVSDDMQALFADPEFPELRQNARDLLSAAGYDPAVAADMNVSQLAQMWRLQEEAAADQPDALANRIDAILGDS